MKSWASLVMLTTMASAADLPVQNVVLFKSGVGYFERSGTLAAGESGRLQFLAQEMNDVLKSLTIRDASGTVITALRYDAAEPLARRLNKFPFEIGPAQAVVALLDKLRGAELEVRLGGETVTGRILSARIVPGTNEKPEQQQVTLVMQGGAVRVIDLSAVTSFRFTDPQLQAQLSEFLSILAQSQSQDKRNVYIDSADSGNRQLTASYMIPAPLWKSSYRLIAGENRKLLEGWAIIDNTTGDDWTNVRLALVSGKPISFISPLYEPRYVERVVAVLPEDGPVAPDLHEGAFSLASPPAANQAARMADGRAEESAAVRQEMHMRKGVVGGVLESVRLNSAAPSTIMGAEGQQVGELFEYRFERPVTVKEGESAMLPFLSQPVDARKLVIYTEEFELHPRHAFLVKNNTGKTLDGGPITVFEDGAYAGEALMETLRKGDERLVSYAVDLGTRITTKFDSSSDIVRQVKARNGVLEVTIARRVTKTYLINNVDEKAKTVVVQYKPEANGKIVSPEPKERTSNSYRFEVAVAANGEASLPVVEEKVLHQSLAVTNLTPDVVLQYAANKTIPEQARQQLRQIAEKKQQLVQVRRQTEDLQRRANEVEQDETRLRQNIESLNRVAGQQDQVQTYARQLAELERVMAQLRDQGSQLRQQQSQLEREIADLVGNLSF